MAHPVDCQSLDAYRTPVAFNVINVTSAGRLMPNGGRAVGTRGIQAPTTPLPPTPVIAVPRVPHPSRRRLVNWLGFDEALGTKTRFLQFGARILVRSFGTTMGKLGLALKMNHLWKYSENPL